MATKLPLYDELLARANVSPVIRPDWDLYWQVSRKLSTDDAELLAALVMQYYGNNSNLVFRNLPGNKGVQINNVSDLPETLQQIILLFLNQVAI